MLIFFIRRLLQHLQPNRTATVSLACYVCFMTICVIADRMPLGLLVTGFFSLVFLLLGFVAFPASLPEFQFALPGREGDALEEKQAVSLSNLRIQASAFPQFFHGQVLVRNWPLLAGLWLLMLATIILMLSSVSFGGLLSSDAGLWTVLLVAMGGATAIGFTATWCDERWFLRRSKLTLGFVQSITTTTSNRLMIRYEFFDLRRERRGGIEYDLSGNQPEPLVFVLYSASNPDKNRSARGLFFHRFALQKHGSHAVT